MAWIARVRDAAVTHSLIIGTAKVEVAIRCLCLYCRTAHSRRITLLADRTGAIRFGVGVHDEDPAIWTRTGTARGRC